MSGDLEILAFSRKGGDFLGKISPDCLAPELLRVLTSRDGNVRKLRRRTGEVTPAAVLLLDCPALRSRVTLQFVLDVQGDDGIGRRGPRARYVLDPSSGRRQPLGPRQHRMASGQ
jgi:hypothetical protein